MLEPHSVHEAISLLEAKESFVNSRNVLVAQALSHFFVLRSSLIDTDVDPANRDIVAATITAGLFAGRL